MMPKLVSVPPSQATRGHGLAGENGRCGSASLNNSLTRRGATTAKNTNFNGGVGAII